MDTSWSMRLSCVSKWGEEVVIFKQRRDGELPKLTTLNPGTNLNRGLRSGTTLLFVELVLQSLGWEEGWAYLQQLAGNLATVTARSFGVPEGLAHGRFPVGIGVGFLARTQQTNGEPLAFLAVRVSAPRDMSAAAATALRQACAAEAMEVFDSHRFGYV